MAESNRFSQSFTERERIVDSLTANPNERAVKILNILKSHSSWKDIDQWDLVCFCIQYLGGILPTFPFIKEVVKKLGQEVYNAHYYYPDKIGICHSEQLLNAEKAHDISKTVSGVLNKSLESLSEGAEKKIITDINHKQ